MAGYIPQEVIEEINRRVDILDLVGRYVRLKRTGRNYIGLCPFHSEDTPSFTVTPDKQIFYCFGCAKGGGAINFLMEIENLSYPEAVRKLAAELNIAIPEKPLSPAEEKRRQERNISLKLHELAAQFYAAALPNSRVAIEYMHKRDVPLELAKRFGLGYASDNDWEALCRYLLDLGYTPEQIEKSGLGGKSGKTGKMYDKFHSRLIFPISNFKGEVIAFGGRILGEGTPKYLNSTETPIYNKSANLFGLNLAGANIRKLDRAVIMEGYMDVLMAHRYGVDNAVASLGTALTAEQAQLLHRYTEHVLLAYDGDAAGQKASLRGIEILRAANFDIRLITLPDDMDPDDFLKKVGKQGWDDYIESNAVGALEFLLNAAVSKHGVDTVGGKARIVKELLPAIAATRSVVERDGFIRLMAESMGVLPESIYADLRGSGLKIAAPTVKAAPANAVEVRVSGNTAPLLRLAIANKAVFDRVEAELGLDFWETAVERELAHIVCGLREQYDWHPVSLLDKINAENAGELQVLANNTEVKRVNYANSSQNEGIKQFLLKLLSKDYPEDNAGQIAAEYILGVKRQLLKKDIAALLMRIQKGESATELLCELQDKQKQLQSLSGN